MAKFFSDDFEDATDFDGTTADASCSVDTAATANPKNGSKHMRVVITATVDDWAHAYEQVDGTVTTECWAQCWVYFHDLPDTSTDDLNILMFTESAGASAIVYAGLYNDGGTVKWYLRNRDSSSFSNTFSAGASPVADTWYQIRLGVVTAAGTGTAELWVDSSLHVDLSGLTNNDRALDYVSVGPLLSTGPTGGTTIDFDDVDIATAEGDLAWSATGGAPTINGVALSLEINTVGNPVEINTVVA